MTKEGSTKNLKFHDSEAGVLVLGRDHISHKVKLHYFFKNLFLYSEPRFIQTKCIEIMTMEGSTKIVNFMTQGAGALVLGCGHISNIVKMPYFLKNLLLYIQLQIRQTESIVMLTKEKSTQIVSFMNPGIW